MRAPLSVYATGRCAEHSPAMAFRMAAIRRELAVPLDETP